MEETKIPGAMRSIRLKCLDCCCGEATEVDKCTSKETCTLWPYRFGKNPPERRKKVSEEQRRATAERFKAYREQKKQENI